LTLTIFVVQCLALAAFLIWAWRGSLRISIALLVWLGATFTLAASGLLNFGPLPPPIFILFTIAFLLTTWLGRSPFGDQLIEERSIGLLIGYQSFRIAVEIFLWLGARDGFVPPQLTWEGRNWDILTGLSAPIVAMLAHRGTLPRTAIVLWNYAGLLLLINVVGVAILSMPTPFRQLSPVNRFVATAPYVWLPIFLVQAAWLGHLLVFRWASVGQSGEAGRIVRQ
jgi:hypothetical protein